MTQHVIKFQAPFERLKCLDVSPDQQLRKAIILQALIDVSNTSDCAQLVKYEIEAKAWIFEKGEYFSQICYEAGMDPDFVIRIAKKVIELKKQKDRLRDKVNHKANDKITKCA